MKLGCSFNALLLCFAACDSSGSMAQLARAPDVASCKPLGETVVDVDATKSADEQTNALRQKAAQAGATHVISEGSSTAGPMKGQMYACPEETSEHASHNSRFGS